MSYANNECEVSQLRMQRFLVALPSANLLSLAIIENNFSLARLIATLSLSKCQTRQFIAIILYRTNVS